MNLFKYLSLILIGSIGLSACHPAKKMSKSSEPYMSLRSELKGAVVLSAGDTIKVIYPELVMFDFGKDEVKAGARSSFVRFSNILKENPTIRVIVYGYTDNSGTDDLNYDLSRRRAVAAHDLLLANGVDASRMNTVGRGPENPMMSNATDYGRSQNRRVEFLLYRVGKQ